MSEASIEETVRAAYRAWETKDRASLERMVGEDFHFTSPYDDHIDRKAFFERCWPNAERIRRIDLTEVMVRGDAAMVRYELTPAEGPRFHNAELLRFRDGKLAEVEVFFGEQNGVEQKP
jgi:ketosteroid isomerase-like protein